MTGGARSLLARLAAAERLAAPACAALLALLVLVPGLGSFGLWDPQEITIADLGRELAKTGDVHAVSQARPPLQIWLIAKSFKTVGVSEWGARLPFVLAAFVILAATYGILCRLARPRAGLLGCLVLLSSPLFVFQARQVTSELPMVAGATLAVYGLIGLAWPKVGRAAWWMAVDGVCAAAGLAIAYYGGAAVLGVLPPLAGVAAGLIALAVAARRAETPSDELTVDEQAAERPPRTLLPMGVVLAVAATALVIAVVIAIYDWMPGRPGQTMWSGKTLAPIKGFIKLVGGVWKPPPAPKDATFDAIINQVVFGLFPWSALVPVALLGGLGRARRDRRGMALLIAAGWALAAYVCAALLERKMGEVRYPALPALAIAAALLLDDLFDQRAAREGVVRVVRPLAALFVFCAAVQIGRDGKTFPDELPSVNVLGVLKMPADLKLVGALPIVGILFGLSFAAALAPIAPPAEPLPASGLAAIATRARKLWARYGALGAAIGLGAACGFGLWLARTWTPELSLHYSYKNVFQTYTDQRASGDVLGVMGIPGNGPEYYARGPFDRLDQGGQGRQALLEYLKRATRVFAIAPVAELCPVQQASSTEGFPYFVVDNENSRYLLLSNKLTPGKTDQNPLQHALRRTPPDKIKKAVSAVYDNSIELLGIDMPERVDHGSVFKVTLYFKVLKKVNGGAWKIFGHFDTKTPPRIIGDHDPIEGRCTTAFWQPGDYVIDTFEVTAGDLSHARGLYTLRVGFFKKSGARYDNMPVTAGNATPDHRVEVGTIRVE